MPWAALVVSEQTRQFYAYMDIADRWLPHLLGTFRAACEEPTTMVVSVTKTAIARFMPSTPFASPSWLEWTVGWGAFKVITPECRSAHPDG